jgi:hypothetical protein
MPVDTVSYVFVLLSYFGGGWREVPGNVSVCTILHFSFGLLYTLYAEVTEQSFLQLHTDIITALVYKFQDLALKFNDLFQILCHQKILMISNIWNLTSCGLVKR